MALKKKPVTGMKDILPREMEIRSYVMNLIRETYATFGFSSIETPCVEHIENLCSKQGGENEKLIFKILKRGEKLRLDEAESEADLVDSGLRYDLTVPLKVPHMGWNSLHFVRENPLFRYVEEGEYVYYVHSFYAKNCEEAVIATSDYGVAITGAAANGNVYGTQFHPEKSGKTGLNILRAFLEI